MIFLGLIQNDTYDEKDSCQEHSQEPARGQKSQARPGLSEGEVIKDLTVGNFYNLKIFKLSTAAVLPSNKNNKVHYCK